jgi:hypothetical protein
MNLESGIWYPDKSIPDTKSRIRIRNTGLFLGVANALSGAAARLYCLQLSACVEENIGLKIINFPLVHSHS